MATKMTWDERRAMHLNLNHEHWDAATQALRRFRDSHDMKDFRAFKSEYHLANKHWGIAEAMWTRKYGKI